MKIKKVFPAILFIMPLLAGCGHEKAVSGGENGGLRKLPAGTMQYQQLNAREVEKAKRTRLFKSRSGQMEVIAASSYQRNLNPVKEEKPLSVVEKPLQTKEKPTAVVEKKVVAESLAIIEPIQVADTAAKEVQIKDTIAGKPFDLSRALAIDAQSAFTPALAATYVRDVSKLKKFSIVVGSFSTLEKAFESVMAMKKIDYRAIIIQNEKGMYRVITGTFNDKDNAEIHKLALTLDSVESWILVK